MTDFDSSDVKELIDDIYQIVQTRRELKHALEEQKVADITMYGYSMMLSLAMFNTHEGNRDKLLAMCDRAEYVMHLNQDEVNALRAYVRALPDIVDEVRKWLMDNLPDVARFSMKLTRALEREAKKLDKETKSDDHGTIWPFNRRFSTDN